MYQGTMAMHQLLSIPDPYVLYGLYPATIYLAARTVFMPLLWDFNELIVI